MKFAPTLYLSILFFLISYNGYSQSLDCSMEFFLPGADFLNLFDTDNTCKGKKTEAEFCNCLQGEFKNNALKKALHDGMSPNDWKKENFNKNRKSLFDIYANLNYEMSFQETIFGMNKNGEGRVGCTPEDMAKEFRSSLCNEYGDCDVIKGGVAIEVSSKLRLTDCSNEDCSDKYNEINNIFKDRYKPYVEPEHTRSPEKENLLAPQGEMFKDSSFDYVPVAAQSALRLCEAAASDDQNTEKSSTEFLNSQLEEARKFYEKHPLLLVTTNFDDLQMLSADCRNARGLVLRVLAEFNEKKQFSQDSSENLDKPFDQQMVEQHLKSSDKKIQDKIRDGYQISLPNACIDYNKYKVVRSSPQESLVKQWSSMTKAELLESLNPKNLKSSSHTTDFLKRNPTIAKNVVSPQQREMLADKLFTLSKKLQKQDSNERLKSYMDFMKNDVPEINTKNKVMDLLQCDLLAQNFAALASTDEFPAIGLEKSDGISSLANQYMACKMREEKAGAEIKPSMNELLAANDLFSLFNGDPFMTDPGQDEGYKDFLDENCKGFTEFVELDMKVSCFWYANKNTCKDKLMNAGHSKRERLLSRYYKINSKTGKLNKLIGENTHKLEVDEVLSKSDILKQDASIKSQYNAIVRDTLKNRSIYNTDNIFNPASESPKSSKDIVAAIKDAQNAYTSSVSPNVANVQNNDNHSKATIKDSYTDSKNTVNPGQFIPPFLKPEPLYPAPKQLATTDDFMNAFENINKYSQEAKEDIVDQSKEFLGNDTSNDKKINDLKKKITEYEKNIESTSNKISSRTPASVGLSKATQKLSGERHIQNYKLAPVTNLSRTQPTSISSKALISYSKENKASASFSKALNQAHEKKNSETSDNIIVNDASKLEFSKKLISKDDFSDDLLISAPLEPDSTAFNQISTSEKAMKEYLLKNVREVGSDEIVSIKCKGPGCNPNMSEILLHFSRGQNKEIIVCSVASDFKVTRTHRIIDLSRTLNSETKITQ